MAKFVIQQKSPQELTQENVSTLTEWTTDEGWGPHQRPFDISHMYSGPPYMDAKAFLGFLDYKMIGHAAFFTSGKGGISTDVMEYITMFIVEKPFRGKGYGLKIWNTMWETMDKNANICLDAAPNMVTKYESMGLKPEWDNREYIIPLSAIAEKYKMTENIRDVSTKLLSEVEFEKFAEYDAKIYGLCQLVFIKRWSTLPNSFTWVAVNGNGDVVGYITIRESINKQDTTVGPLYADNLEIAKKLIYTASQTMSSQTSSVKNLRMFIPTGGSNAIQMIESDFGIKCGPNFVRMYSKKHKVDLNKVIAINSPGYG
ncbi:holothin acyltransferase-like [Dysidea avara]|uniref:holothin acyltransferase-like n=1 Tax=Dysidea avara TaxID=196820 RepID=UPI0033245557